MDTQSLAVGDVFLAKNISLCGDNPHYHIVIHKTIENKIVVVYTTKEIEKTEERCKAKERPKFHNTELETMVLINNSQCAILKVDSAINCNNVDFKPESFFINLPSFKKYDPITDLSLIPKIINGIKNSPVVPQYIIKIL